MADRQIPEDDERDLKQPAFLKNKASFAGRQNKVKNKYRQASLMSKIKGKAAQASGQPMTEHQLHKHHVNHKTHMANQYRKNLYSKNPVNK